MASDAFTSRLPAMAQANLTDDFRLADGVTAALQLRTLRTLLRHLAARAGMAGSTPLVEVDLDLTAVMPVYRTRQALIEAGKVVAVEQFLHPERLPILPGYSDEAWVEFVLRLRLPSLYPAIPWVNADGGPDSTAGGPFATFHEAYWNSKFIVDDTPTPGLGSFVCRVCEAGGEVVFLSGRWLPEHIPATLATLRRAGIVEPKLVIGNDRHPSRVAADQALSDAQVKALHQDEVLKFGAPVAIIDDRVTNRTAVINRAGTGVLGIAACIPGFTHDPASNGEVLRISTFETFDCVVGDSPRRPFMTRRYPRLGAGDAWNGTYEGLGLNKLPYVLPRLCRELQFDRPFEALTRGARHASLEEEEFLDLCARTLPAGVLDEIDICLEQARAMSADGMAAPFPVSELDRRRLRWSIVASWLHSRDIQQLMAALGYMLPAAGVHDIHEFVPADDLKARIGAAAGNRTAYSEWVLKWVDSLSREADVDVGCMNPALAVGMWRWTPHDIRQDAMDIHRLSSHHTGDGFERYDPVEAAVNNVLHQREGYLGIRKEAVVSWENILMSIERDSHAEAFGKSSVACRVLRDAVLAGIDLETRGCITPWGLLGTQL
jgi:hypothetical protein